MIESPPLALTLIESARDLPPEWEALRREEQVALDPRVLGAFEAAAVPGVRTVYAMVTGKGQVLAGAAMHRVEIRLDRQRLDWLEPLVRKAKNAGREDLLRFRALMCGLNLSQGRDDLVSGPAPPAPEVVRILAQWAEQVAAAEHLDGVLFAHLHESRRSPFAVLAELDYTLLPSLGYATLPVTWNGLDGYLAQLRASHRRQVRATRQRLEDAGLEVCPTLDLHAHAEEFLPLYQAVFDRAAQRIEALNGSFFRNLARACPQEAGLTGIKKEGRLVAAAVTLRTDNRLCCLEVGLDYALQARSDLYLNLLLALAERAGTLGAAHLDLGQTALAAKANLGARIEPTWLLVKARSPLLHAALRVERADLNPPALPHRNVFRGMPATAPPAEPNPDRRAAAAGGAWARHVNPDLAAYLALLRMDRIYVRGAGHRLWDVEGREVFDLAGGYGALPFGHNPAWLWEEVMNLAGRHAPQWVQGSLAPEAGELAALLCRNAPEGIRYCVFANSGTEAVEVAIKAARAATGRPGIIVARGGFHGKTLGALSATSARWYQEPFRAPAPGFVSVEYGDAADLERTILERDGEIAAFLVEPVQGEAGVIIPPPGYLGAVAEICSRHGILLLVDEVQTGLGRLGQLFACTAEGVSPDAIMLSKALGGGLVPAAACLLSARAWSESLALRHSSTFAGGTLAMTVGLAVVRKLLADKGAVLQRVRLSGEEWRQRLGNIAGEGAAIAGVRGAGLLLGLEIGNLDQVDSPILRSLARQRKLVPLICGYLLNVHGLRVMPPLARRTTLRLLPPFDAPAELLDRTCAAFADLRDRLDSGDLRGLTRYLLGTNLPAPLTRTVHRKQPAPGRATTPPLAGTFAFITTALDHESYRQLEPSLAGCGDIEIGNFERMVRDTAGVAELSEITLRSRTGVYCRGWFLGLPFTSRELLSLPPDEALRWVRKAVARAKKLGARIVGLGAMTSVVTKGGMALRNEGVGMTTGNSYTVAAAMESLSLAIGSLGLDPRDETCAVIGATGSIGRVCARLCGEFSERIILVGRPEGRKVMQRLSGLAEEIRTHCPRVREARSTVDLAAAVGEARIVICATSSPDPVLDATLLRSGSIVCDLARPADVASGARERRNDLLVIDGGIVRLPESADLGWRFGLEPGTLYACMAETIALAFDGWRNHYGLGPRGILSTYRDAEERAKRHGFRVVGPRSFGQPLAEEEIARIRRNAGIFPASHQSEG